MGSPSSRTTWAMSMVSGVPAGGCPFGNTFCLKESVKGRLAVSPLVVMVPATSLVMVTFGRTASAAASSNRRPVKVTVSRLWFAAASGLRISSRTSSLVMTSPRSVSRTVSFGAIRLAARR